jgi:hypothetical protein
MFGGLYTWTDTTSAITSAHLVTPCQALTADAAAHSAEAVLHGPCSMAAGCSYQEAKHTDADAHAPSNAAQGRGHML